MPETGDPAGFTGERLHDGSELFAADLARHRAAYRFAIEHFDGRAAAPPLLFDLGSGAGYGCHELAAAGLRVVGVDRVAPDRVAPDRGAFFVRADLFRLPLRPAAFDGGVSFQVIEHLERPGPYLDAMARALRPGGSALLSTPNLLLSDGVNPHHVREYTAEELEELLRGHFDEVSMLGVGTTERARSFLEARRRQVARLLRLDPFGLRHRLPRRLIERLFGLLAVQVRKAIRRRRGVLDLDWTDFPIGPVDDSSLDLLAVCRRG